MEKSGGGRPPESSGGCRGEAEDAEEGLEGAKQENTREHHEGHSGGGGGHCNHAPTVEDRSPGRGEVDQDAEDRGAGGAEKKGGGGSGWRVGGGPDLLHGWLRCRRGHKRGSGRRHIQGRGGGEKMEWPGRGRVQLLWSGANGTFGGGEMAGGGSRGVENGGPSDRQPLPGGGVAGWGH